MTKSTKSHLRGLSSLLKNTPPVSATPTNALRALVHSPLLKNTLRVHELVARAMRGECVRHGAKVKSVVLPLPTISAIPRVRTYHTKKPSRFVHALSARPLKKVGIDRFAEQTRSASPRQGKRAWSGLCADEIEFASLFLLLALLGLYLVGELTHMRSMCVGVAETGVVEAPTRYLVGANIVRPRRYLKKLFFFSRFSLTKSAAKVI